MNLFSFFIRDPQIRHTEIVPFIRLWLSKSKRPKQYIYRYVNLCNKLSGFEVVSGLTLYTDSFTENMSEQFILYLRSRPEHYTTCTIGKFIDLLVTMLNRASKAGYEVNLDIKDYPLKKDYLETISLSQRDLDVLNAMKLRKEAAAVRDRFLLGCYTAQRYSDYSSITTNNIINGLIQIRQAKTGIVVKIPIHPVIKDILKRNNGEFPPVPSSQAFNKTIKRLCKRAGIDETILIERMRGLKMTKKKYKKYELISSHTARRTGATLMILSGVPVTRAMLITGHSTQKTFFQYVGINKTENAKILQEYSFFNPTAS